MLFNLFTLGLAAAAAVSSVAAAAHHHTSEQIRRSLDYHSVPINHRAPHRGSRRTGNGAEASVVASATSLESQAAATEASSAAASTTTSSSSSSSSSSSTFTGKATFFYQEGVAGACGTVNADSALIVALDEALYAESYCDKKVYITNTSNGKSVEATVADECPGCSSEYSLDLSTGTFDSIGDESTGVLDIEWYFVD